MPVSDFRWVAKKERENLRILKMTDNQDIGYILEVDLIYPDHLHEEHGSFPLAPERLHVNNTMLSQYAKGTYDISFFINYKTCVPIVCRGEQLG